MFCFSLDHLQETVFHPDRCDDQTVPALWLRITGKHVECSRRILSETFIAGKDTAVCIKFGCGIVVVTGCQMHITADAGLFSSNDQSDLAVCLETDKTVDYMAAGFFEHFCPDDVIFLVESGLQFHQYRNLFTIFCCLCKRCDDR